MAGATPMIEVLPDVLDYGLILVFCGTAASTVSARQGAYYANRGNAFWGTLHMTGITPRLLAPSDFHDLLDLKIGLTDLAKFSAGSDSQLRRNDFQPDQLRQKIVRYQPQIIAFTSKTAWRAWNRLPASCAVVYGWQDDCLGATRFFVLPSPSGAARRYWDADLWQDLSDAYACRISSP